MTVDLELPVGVMDSGVGGISTLRALRRLMPQERFLYYGDCGNAPYGTKEEKEILHLTKDVAQHLLARGIKQLVIACNTATSAAAKELRTWFPVDVVGIEPAVKPAAEAVGDGVMLLLATPATIRQEKLRLLVEKWGRNTVPLPCPGLMEFAERGEFSSARLDAYLRELFAPWADKRVDACVLGCTHYPFLRDAIAKALPGTSLFDGNEGTARQSRRLLEAKGLLRPEGAKGSVELLASGDAEREIRNMERLLYAP